MTNLRIEENESNSPLANSAVIPYSVEKLRDNMRISKYWRELNKVIWDSDKFENYIEANDLETEVFDLFITLLGIFDSANDNKEVYENIGDDATAEQYNSETVARTHYLEGRIYSEISEKKIIQIINSWLEEFSNRNDLFYEYLEKELNYFFNENKLDFVIDNYKIEKKTPIIEIELIENGLHSFIKGTVYLGNFIDTKEKLVFKDAVVSTHHGIELLAKSLLIDYNELLIYNDLTEYRKKIEAEKTNEDKSSNNSFSTISYTEALCRVRTFLEDIPLEDKIMQDLEKLNIMRNNLEHFTIRVDVQKYIFNLINVQEKMLHIFRNSIPNFAKHFHALMNTDSKLRDDYSEALKRNQEYLQLEEEIMLMETKLSSIEIQHDFYPSDGEEINENHIIYNFIKRFSSDFKSEEQLQKLVVEIVDLMNKYTVITGWINKKPIIKELRMNFKLTIKDFINSEINLNQITDIFIDLIKSIKKLH